VHHAPELAHERVLVGRERAAVERREFVVELCRAGSPDRLRAEAARDSGDLVFHAIVRHNDREALADRSPRRAPS